MTVLRILSRCWEESRRLAAVLLTGMLLCLAFPAGTLSSPGEGAGRPVSGSEISRDPLGRLPATPLQAHARLEGGEFSWPQADGCTSTPSGQEGIPGEGSTGFAAASVTAGSLRVALPFDTVEGVITHAETGVRVELLRGSSVWSMETTASKTGWFATDFTSIGQDIRSGDRVRVTDLGGGTPVTVDCTLTATLEPGNDRVSGSVAPGNTVDVYIRTPSTYYGDIPPGVAYRRVKAESGSFSTTFSEMDIWAGDVAYVFSTDGAGNAVMEVAGAGGVLVVYPQYDEVMGYHVPGAPVTVKAASASRTVGCSGSGFFDAWFSDFDILPGQKVSAELGTARSITVADVSASADPLTNVVSGKAPPDRELRITINTYRQPVQVRTRSGSDGSFSCDLSGRYAVSGTEVFNVAWYDDDGDCVVYEFQTYSWYLPEGYTGQGFDEWVLIMNPGEDTAQVRVLFQTLVGQVEGPLLLAQPGSRVTVHVNEWAPDHHVSTMVTAMDGGEIMSERAMYMYGTVDGKWGAHDSVGILNPSPVWYLPEGYTGPGFDEWVLIQNPNNVEVDLRVQFLARGGVAKELRRTLGARSRHSIRVNDHLINMEISTKVESLTVVGGETLPVFAERAMYMDTPDGKRGAHDSIGSSTPAPEWYLPEGTTRPGFDEWVLVMNPNDQPTTVRATFLTPRGVGGTHELRMEPHSRGTIHVNEFIVNDDVSTVVTSLEGAGILAERAMYMDTPDGKRGAHDSIGSFQASTRWYLPEGTTRPGFDQWVLVQNPEEKRAEVRVTLLGPAGPLTSVSFTMSPRSRHSVHVNELVDDLDVATLVESVGSDPARILAERAMYMWTPDFKQGSHCSIGIPE